MSSPARSSLVEDDGCAASRLPPAVWPGAAAAVGCCRIRVSLDVLTRIKKNGGKNTCAERISCHAETKANKKEFKKKKKKRESTNSYSYTLGVMRVCTRTQRQIHIKGERDMNIILTHSFGQEKM